MLDSDLAFLYEIETKVLNQAVKRNVERFPLAFRFQLSAEELLDLRSQIVTSNEHYHLGVSLKDLGKKWFAFSRMDSFSKQVLKQIQADKL